MRSIIKLLNVIGLFNYKNMDFYRLIPNITLKILIDLFHSINYLFKVYIFINHTHYFFL